MIASIRCDAGVSSSMRCELEVRLKFGEDSIEPARFQRLPKAASLRVPKQDAMKFDIHDAVSEEMVFQFVFLIYSPILQRFYTSTRRSV